MSGDQEQACLEAAHALSDRSFVVKHLLELALSFKQSAEEKWEWRIEDEA